MGSTNGRPTRKWWYPHTKKFKCFSSAKFDYHNNKFVNGLSTGYELITGKKIPLSNIKINLSFHPFIKDDIFEVTVIFPPIVTYIGIVDQYCERHNMSYIPQSTNNSPWNHDSPTRNRTNVWILRIGT